MEFVKQRGVERIYQEELGKTSYLYAQLSKLKKVKLYTPPPQSPWFAPVLSFNVEGMSSEAVGAKLAKEGVAVRCGLHCAPAAHEKMGTKETGTVRISPSVFTRREELDVLVRAVAKL